MSRGKYTIQNSVAGARKTWLKLTLDSQISWISTAIHEVASGAIRQTVSCPVSASKIFA